MKYINQLSLCYRPFQTALIEDYSNPSKERERERNSEIKQYQYQYECKKQAPVCKDAYSDCGEWALNGECSDNLVRLSAFGACGFKK